MVVCAILFLKELHHHFSFDFLSHKMSPQRNFFAAFKICASLINRERRSDPTSVGNTNSIPFLTVVQYSNILKENTRYRSSGGSNELNFLSIDDRRAITTRKNIITKMCCPCICMADNVQHVNHDNQQNYVTRLFVPFGLSSHVNNQTEFIIFTS